MTNRVVNNSKTAMVRNIYSLDEPGNSKDERFDEIRRSGSILIERIVSTGQATPEGEWYDQEQDEWVILLQGRATLRFESGETAEFAAGDHLFIPAHCRHRVEKTSACPPCFWIAVHGNLHTS
jgi:cupin 2 domain-containing protein